jgi:hypothetical protein
MSPESLSSKYTETNEESLVSLRRLSMRGLPRSSTPLRSVSEPSSDVDPIDDAIVRYLEECVDFILSVAHAMKESCCLRIFRRCHQYARPRREPMTSRTIRKSPPADIAQKETGREEEREGGKERERERESGKNCKQCY